MALLHPHLAGPLKHPEVLQENSKLPEGKLEVP